MNALGAEKSPYLQQHASNPVDWYPWGAAAIERARSENKPILLSIGYSTCHWCHVMEHESFCDLATAAVMNRHFVCIKVDREERPDIDAIYMTALQLMTGSGGWPLNIFLTPELQPFFGGTYFPPKARQGQASWTELLERIAHIWQHDRAKITTSAAALAQHLQTALTPQNDSADISAAVLPAIWQSLHDSFDKQHGGFGPAPKFPMPLVHQFLLELKHFLPDQYLQAQEASLTTLQAMANGGIYDQVGGGFHRYSTDTFWHVPHFEKMLYDNAQLAWVYLRAFELTNQNFLLDTARGVLDYMLRDLACPQGAFYAAQDADSLEHTASDKKIEGAFYVWSLQELQNILDPAHLPIAQSYFGLKPEGNAPHDPWGEFKGKNILHVAQTPQKIAQDLNLDLDSVLAAIKQIKAVLFDQRQTRPSVHRDEKIVVAWNALAISALVKAYIVTRQETYLHSAQKTAHFIRQKLYDPTTKKLARSWCQGALGAGGVAEDYAFMAQALIDLYAADFDTDHLDWAQDLTQTLQQKFAQDNGGYFMAGADQDPYLNWRSSTDYDSVEPAAVSVATRNLLCLSALFNRADYQAAATKNLRALMPTLQNQPRALPLLALNIPFAQGTFAEFVCSATDFASAQDLLNIAQKNVLPCKILIAICDEKSRHYWQQKRPELAHLTQNKNAQIQLCYQKTCLPPVYTAAQLQSAIDQL